MENIESRIIEGAIVVSVLVFLFPFGLWLHNILDKAKLLRINSFEEFKEKMKLRMLPDKKLFKPASWFRPTALTLEEIMKEFMKMEEKLKKSKIIRFLFIVMPIIIYFAFYVSLSDNIGHYYIKLKTGYEISQEEYFKEILRDVIFLVLLSLWIAFVLFHKLAIHRINIFLKKFEEFKDVLKGEQ